MKNKKGGYAGDAETVAASPSEPRFKSHLASHYSPSVQVFSTLFFHHGFFCQNSLNSACFPFCFGARVCLASVSVDHVRDVINVSSAEVPDAKVLKMVKRAEVTLELATSREIDYMNPL